MTASRSSRLAGEPPRAVGVRRRPWRRPATLVLALAVGMALAGLAALATGSANAEPAESVAARDRDEDLRVERFMPPAAAVAGVVGLTLARRFRERRLEQVVTIGAPLLAAALAIGPLVAIGPRPLNRQPSPDAQEYADAARHLAAGDGYVTTIYRNEERPPRYPPGFSAALAPFALAGRYPANVQLGAKVYAILYVVATLATAWVVGGPLAAAVAVALVGSSPFGVRYASLVMSDAFAAGLAVLGLALIHRPTRARAAGAGLVAGALVLVRLSGLLGVAALAASPVASRAHRRLVVPAVAGSLVGMIVLGAHQWSSFGTPFMTGYQFWLPEIRTFGLDYPFSLDSQRDGSGVVADSLDGALVAWACPCPGDDPLTAFRAIAFYPLVLLGIFWIFTPPLATIPGAIEVWRRRTEPGPAFVLWLTVLTLLFHLVYFYIGARFVAAPATLLAIYTGVAVARWAERIADRGAGGHAANGAEAPAVRGVPGGPGRPADREHVAGIVEPRTARPA